MSRMVVDTSPALVAIAAIQAVWAACSCVPSAEQNARLEALVLRSHKLSVGQLKAELLR